MIGEVYGRGESARKPARRVLVAVDATAPNRHEFRRNLTTV